MRPRRTALFVALAFQFICSAKIMPRREPVDGALNATHIMIVKPLAHDGFRVEESFFGDAVRGQVLELPGFKLLVEDRSLGMVGRDRVEPIHAQMRILIFLMRAPLAPKFQAWKRYGDWAVAGYGNCYFWSDDPDKLQALRDMATSALTFRQRWEAARDTTDVHQRIEKLWPFLWNPAAYSYDRTQAELQNIGAPAGDYIADQLETMTDRQKDVFLNGLGAYHSARLHTALIRELERQRTTLERALEDQSRSAVPSDHYGILYQGLIGLGGFEDHNDLPFIRELAQWAMKYRFKQIDDAALIAFGKLPDRANLPVIAAIWREFSERPWQGNELHSFDVIKALASHGYVETIPLMAQFVNVGFYQEVAREFLVQVTGVDYGGDEAKWIQWYESHRAN